MIRAQRLPPFTGLYDGLVASLDESRRRTVAVLGLGPRHGATTVALGLTHAATAGGRDVTLVDARLHRPVLTRELRLTDRVGLGELLDDHAVDPIAAVAPPRGDAAGAWGCLPAGRHHGPGVHSAGSWRRVLAGLAASDLGDWTVVDAGPIHDDQALLAAAACDAAVLVVRAERTRVPAVDAAVAHCRRRGCPLHALVLNRRRFVIPRWLYRWL